MKINIIKLLCMLLVLSSISCSPEKSEVHIDMNLTDSHRHMGHGYYMSVPDIYEPANSYDGFQVSGYESSIAIESHYETFEDLISVYHKDNFRSSDLDLNEVRPVTGPDGFRGLLVVIENNVQKRMDIRFFFEDNEKTYGIKAFYFKPLSEKYKETVRKAILSLARGEEERKAEDLQLASIGSSFSSGAFYTRDGLYPTEENDDMTLVEKQIENIIVSNISDLMEKAIKEISSDAEYKGTLIENLGNGKKHYAEIETNEKRGIVMLITDDETNEAVLIKCYGNADLSFKMINDIINKRYFTLSIDRPQ